MPRKGNKILSVGGPDNAFQGVMLNLAPEDMPPFVFQNLINLEPADKVGNLVKRGRYSALITDDHTAVGMSSIKEFVDKNDVRQIVIKKSGDLYQSVYAGGSYGSQQKINGTSNDKRTSGAMLSDSNPIIFDRVYRSGSGIAHDSDYPLWFGHIDTQTRFPINGTRYQGSETNNETVISAGKYLCDQLLCQDTLKDVISLYARMTYSFATDKGLNFEFETTDSKYIGVYAVPVFDGYQTGFLSKYGKQDQLFSYLFYMVQVPYDDTYLYNLETLLYFHKDKLNYLPRLTHIDLFVTNVVDQNYFNNYGPADRLVPAYFLERIPLTDDADMILTMEGTFEAANPPTYIHWIPVAEEWNTFDLEYYFAEIVVGTTKTSFLLGATTFDGTTGSGRFKTAVSGVPNSYNGQTYKFVIKSKWLTVPGYDHQYIKSIYDNYHRKLRSYFYDYANIPEGDEGLDNLSYKFSCEAGRRLFIFGRDDGFGYFSLPGKPDVIPALNILRPKWKETGCVGIDKDVLVFSKFNTTRIQVLSNENAIQDDEFLNTGCVGQKSIVKLDEYTIAWMSYKGPYLLSGREAKPIGDVLQEWWDKTLTNDQKEDCCAGYNYKKDQIWFSFPTYVSDDFPYGIIFVFDLKAYRKNFITSWFYFRSDVSIQQFDLNHDGHLITMSEYDSRGEGLDANKILDWNPDTATESCDWLIKMLVLKNDIQGKRCRISYKKFYIDYTTDDNITARIYMDGSATPVNLTLNANYEAFIHYLSESLELEIVGQDTVNDCTIKKMQLTFKEKSF